jgi:4-amino-4-deoxy-L-arabinose transferase-like glycosyltransferase
MDTTRTLPRPTGAAPEDAAAATVDDGTHSPTTRETDGTGRLGRWWRGPTDDPAWARPALIGLLLATGVLYLWGLGASGWANSFYSAAAQAGSESWKAFFFGSSDAASSITVDKTPLALWPMALSVRIFGLSSWSILVPQALEGIATVALLHSIVRRTTGSAVSGLIAGAAMALTPVAVLMFRFNNPDAMLVLLMVGAAGATLRAVEVSTSSTSGSGSAMRWGPVHWLALGGALVGLAFLTKMLQAFLVLPALALVYLLFARTAWGKRIVHLLVAFGTMLLAGGWWVAIVALWPAGSRPYIGGSQDNSILELTLGYNGFGRLTGDEVGSVGGGTRAGGGGMWGATGLFRLFGNEIGGQAAWLVPAALVLGVAGLWFGRRSNPIRAGLTLWLTWLVVTGLTFSFMAGIFHAYYTVALAPAVAALVGIGSWLLWRHRASMLATSVLGFAVTMTAVLAWYLLGRTSDFLPALRWVVLVVGLVAGFGVAIAGHLPRRIALAAAFLALMTSLAGPAAYAVNTAATPHTGSIPTAGPATARGAGPAGGGRPGGFRGGPPQGNTQAPPTGATGTTGTTGGAPTQGGPGGAGGLLDASTSPAAVTKLLQTDADSYTWAAAAIGSNTASGYQLASGRSVMPIGGFNGSDPSPTLAQFEKYVANGQIHYFIASAGAGGGPGGNGSSAITKWVEANFTATTVSGVTLYDLSGGIK